MLIDFIEIRDFFEDPYEILLLAKQQSFVEKSAHYHNVNNSVFFNGVRSKTLQDISEEAYRSIHERIFSKIIDARFKDDISKIRVDYTYGSHAYFHIMREQDKFGPGWLHKDTKSVLAGVIYLNPNPRPNTGTMVYKYGEDKDPIIVENEFNKLVLYDSSYTHAPQGGFGTDINDSRLSLVFFIGDIGLRVGLAEHLDAEETNEE